MIQLLIDNPLLLLFLIAALGYPLGRITIAGSSLGVAAVLFVGLAIGGLHPELKLPALVYQLGLVVFVYTIGLSSGRQFFSSFRRQGVRDAGFVLIVLVVALGVTFVVSRLLTLSPRLATGVFMGSLTNTAALASSLEYIGRIAPADVRDQWLAEPVVGFSITYPMGVIGVILAIMVMHKIWTPDAALEAERLHALGVVPEQVENRTIRVTRREATGVALQDLIKQQGWNAVFGRYRHDGRLSLAGGHTQVCVGDLVSVIGPPSVVAQVTAYLGDVSEERLELDRHEFDARRIFVSQHAVAGRRIRDLQLPQQFGAFITRVRRGDSDLLAHGSTVLELGDRVRVVARPDTMEAVSSFFGDSYRALSEIDILTFNLGLAFGLLVGMIPIPLPGGITITLGFAGGPLIVALILGMLERTGPLVWNLPYSANLTLRQIGLILFLAGIGSRSGYEFVSTLGQGGGAGLFLAGMVITFITVLVALWIGYRVLQIPMPLLMGMIAGIQTQPAVLGYALEQTGDDVPNVGYAATYPLALIAKIVIAQVLLAFGT